MIMEQVMFVSTLREKKINYNDPSLPMGAIGGSKYGKETNTACRCRCQQSEP